MTPDQTELLIRVDQNVINIVKLFDNHLSDDKEYQDTTDDRLASLETTRSENKGMLRIGNLIYGMLGGIASLVGGYLITKA